MENCGLIVISLVIYACKPVFVIYDQPLETVIGKVAKMHTRTAHTDTAIYVQTRTSANHNTAIMIWLNQSQSP
jgi:hypothetical protein